LCCGSHLPGEPASSVGFIFNGSRKGTYDMNAAGLFVALTGVSGYLHMAFFQNIVDDGSVRQDELDGTRNNLTRIVAALKGTPPAKIESMVAQYDEQLTEHLGKFNANGATYLLPAFREAQTMTGYVATIMAKAGITE
jgi:hypothetical protein